MALSAKQRKFVNEYLKSRNAAKAARAAGYSAKAAETNGPRLLRNAQVKAAVEASLDRATEKAELTAAEVLAEIRKLAFVDGTTAFKSDGSMLPFHEMPEDVRKSIVGSETVELFAGRGATRRQIGHVRKIKHADKVRALELLAKHFKLLTEVHEHSGKDGGPLVVLTMPANGSEAVEPEPVKTDEAAQ